MSSGHTCPNCGKEAMSTFYEARDVPVHSCILVPTQQQSLEFPRGTISLGFCEECGFISNVAFDPLAVDYSAPYEFLQCFSPTFNVFAQKLAKRLIEKYNLRNKDIMDIGCGQGDFLMLICELGENRGVGIDPGYYIKDLINSKASARVKFIKDYYSEHYAKYHGDLVCCRHTLEHIHNTQEFVNTVRSAIGNRLSTIVFFELPDVIRVLRELAFWDIYHEHCSYFSPGSLARLFRSCKFEIIDLYMDYNDQWILMETRPVSQVSDKVPELEESVQEMAKYVKYFSAHCHEMLNHWKNRLQQIHADETRVVLWGSSSKCVSFMTTLGVKDEIEYVVDINPYIQGKFLPGTGKEIMPPEFLKKYKPDLTIVMNPTYYDEVSQKLDDIEVNTEVVSILAL